MLEYRKTLVRLYNKGYSKIYTPLPSTGKPYDLEVSHRQGRAVYHNKPNIFAAQTFDCLEHLLPLNVLCGFPLCLSEVILFLLITKQCT